MVEQTTSASQWKDNLENNTGEISLTSEIEQELLVLDGLYLPEMVQAVVFANQQLNENGYFNGRLPKGSYVYGDLHFDIVPNEEKVFAVRKEETPKRNEKRSKKRLEKIFNSKKKLPAGLIAATFYYLYKLS